MRRAQPASASTALATLSDAARVDGAGELRILFRIILPLCKPALAQRTFIQGITMSGIKQ